MLSPFAHAIVNEPEQDVEDEDLLRGQATDDDNDDPIDRDAGGESGQAPVSRGAETRGADAQENPLRGADFFIGDLVQRLDRIERTNAALFDRVHETSLMNDLQEAYKKDPASATAMLFRRARQEAMSDLESRMHKVLDDQVKVNRMMNEFFDLPNHSDLKEFRREVEDLVLEMGASPSQAAELVRRIGVKANSASGRRSAAARQIRNRSAVETGGASDERSSGEKEFNRVLKKSKTLSEMFEGLSKLRL
jgi:hypothetical protein